MKIAIFNVENYVENIIEVTHGESLDMLQGLTWLDVSGEEVSVGQEYFPDLQKFKPLQTRDNFVFDESKWEWVHPVAPPSDATWVPEIDGPETDEHKALEIKRIYFWIDKYQTWGMTPCTCIPKPGPDFYWNPIEKEWQTADSEKPGEDFTWNTLDKTWIKILPPPTMSTE